MVQRSARQCHSLQRDEATGATSCSAVERATQCNILQRSTARCRAVQPAASQRGALQRRAACCNTEQRGEHDELYCDAVLHATVACYLLQHSKTCCNAVQHGAKRTHAVRLEWARARARRARLFGFALACYRRLGIKLTVRHTLQPDHGAEDKTAREAQHCENSRRWSRVARVRCCCCSSASA